MDKRAPYKARIARSFPLHEMGDYETLELIHRLSLQDAQERKATLDRAYPRTGLTDERLALEVHTKELNQSLQRVVDAKVVRRLNPTPVDSQRKDVGNVEIKDRKTAPESAVPPIRPKAAPVRGTASRGRGRGGKVAANARPTKPSAPSPTVDCVGCHDPIGQQSHILTRCGHAYDPKCVVNMVEAATKNENLFPPRCCGQEIPKRAIVPLLPNDTRLKYDAAVKEFAIDRRERVYCNRKGCSRFLSRATTEDEPTSSIFCKICSARTCSRCGGRAHSKLLQCRRKAM